MKTDPKKLRVVFLVTAGAAVLAGALVLAMLAGKAREAGLEYRAAREKLFEARRIAAGPLPGAGTARRLVAEENLSLAIDELARRGRAAGVNFLSVTPREPLVSGSALYKTLPVELETRSTFAGLGEFLGALDELEQGIVTVESFTMVPQKENAATLESRLVLHLFLVGDKR